MSERRKAQGESDSRGSEPQTWRSETWEDLELDFGSDRASLASEGQAWMINVPEERWIVGLLRLIERRSWWVGTEERLFERLRAFAGEEVYQSGDFPSTLDELHKHIALARRMFSRLDLDVLDYRELSQESLKYWREEVTYLPGASAWGPEAPMLVCRRSRTPAVEYYWALGKVLKHWDPFPLSVLLFTERDDNYGLAGRWIGPSFMLVNILRRHYPTFENVPYDIADLASPPGARGCLPAYENIREYGRLFEPLRKDDYSPFSERMLASIPILREVGIRVRRVDRSEDQGGAEHTDPSRTEWIIEALPWDNPDLF